MMTKDEVTSIVTYCQMHNVSYKKRLEEFGVPTWKFYEYKARYAAEASSCQTEFIQITDGGSYVPASRLESTRGAKSRPQTSEITNHLSPIRLLATSALRLHLS